MSKRTKITPRLSSAVTPSLHQSNSVKKGVSSSRIILPPASVDKAETVGATSQKQDVIRAPSMHKDGAAVKSVKRNPTFVKVKPQSEPEKMADKGPGVYVVEVDDEEVEQVPHRLPHDNLLISCFVFWACFGWPLGVILSLLARRENKRQNYDKSDCYGKIALYTNVMIMALGIVGYTILIIWDDRR